MRQNFLRAGSLESVAMRKSLGSGLEGHLRQKHRLPTKANLPTEEALGNKAR